MIGRASRSLVLVLASRPAPARAQFWPRLSAARRENIEGFTVVGKGRSPPGRTGLEIDLEVSAASELTADAIVKYRDAQKQAPGGVRRAEARQRRRRGAGAARRPEGACSINPYFFDYQPNQPGQDRGPALAEARRQGTDIRKMDEEPCSSSSPGCSTSPRTPGARSGRQNDIDLLLLYIRNSRTTAWCGSSSTTSTSSRRKRTRRRSPTRGRGPSGWRGSAASSWGRSWRSAKSSCPARRQTRTSTRRGTTTRPPHKRLESSKFQEIPVRVELLVRFDGPYQGRGKGADG